MSFDKTVQFRVDRDTWVLLDRLAIKMGRTSVSAIMRMIFERCKRDGVLDRLSKMADEKAA